MRTAKKIITTSLIFLVALIGGYQIKESYLLNKNTVKVYFVKSNKKGEASLVKTRRRLTPDNSKMQIAISELVKGPSVEEKKQGLYSEIPAKTKLIGISEVSDKITINLSNDFQAGGGSDSLMTRANQIILTAKEASGKKPVYLELEGKRADVIGGEGIIIDQPLGKRVAK